jgi:hypothetical protein
LEAIFLSEVAVVIEETPEMQAQVETRPIRSAYQQHHRISTALSSANPRNPQNWPLALPRIEFCPFSGGRGSCRA